MIVVEYHPGGANANAPGLGRSYQADSITGTVTIWNTAGLQITSRSLTEDEITWLSEVVIQGQRDTNRSTMSDRDTLISALDEIKTFLNDVDIQASLDRPNNQAPTAQELNRTLKALIRQERRSAQLVTRLAKYVFSQAHPDLLDEDS
jgi:hypothetical protein